MDNYSQALANSETLRLMKMGNPDSMKDFKQDAPAMGWLDIERKLKGSLLDSIQKSDDPNGVVARYDTALMLNNIGMDLDQAFELSDMGLASSVSGIDLGDKSYWEALKTKASEYWSNSMLGKNTSLYMITGNTGFLKNAEEYQRRIISNPILNDYGEFGELGLDSVQTLLSSAEFIATSALLSWIPGGVANLAWGPAVAKAISGAGQAIATGMNVVSSGYTQMGNTLYNVMQMEDSEGNRLPWESTQSQLLFHALAITSGLVEVGSMELFPWYKQLKAAFGTRELSKQLEKGFLNASKNFLWETAKGDAGEALEEGIGKSLENGYISALQFMANKEGASFEIKSIEEVAKEAAKATTEAARSMFLTSFITAGVGQGVYSTTMRLNANKTFKSTEKSIPIDSSFVSVPTKDVLTAYDESNKKEKPEGKEKTGSGKPDKKTVGKIEPVRVAHIGSRLVPINQEEMDKAAQAKLQGAPAMNVVVEEGEYLNDSDHVSLVNDAARTMGARVGDSDVVVFSSEEDLEQGVASFEPFTEAVTREGDLVTMVMRDSSGDLVKITATANPSEKMEITEPEQAFDAELNPQQRSLLGEDKYLQYQERKLVKSSIGDLVSHTGGRVSPVALESNVDAVIMVAEALHMGTDEMLSQGLGFVLDTQTPARGYIDNVTEDGKKKYTIHLGRKADASTVLHELGHFVRGTADRTLVDEFKGHYGGALWIEDVSRNQDGTFTLDGKTYGNEEEAMAVVRPFEERFADDFVRYLRTGEAPTTGLKRVFRRMRDILRGFMEFAGSDLSPEVKASFGRILQGKSMQQEIPVGPDGYVMFQNADDRYFKALENGDEEAARKIVDDIARKKGYLSDNDFRMNHKAPNREDENLSKLGESDLVPKDYWDHPNWYTGEGERESFWQVKNAIDRYRKNGKARIRLYRAIPKNIKEDMFRNGDWVTPDRAYAQNEGAMIPEGYRIIYHSVPIEHVWWDVNSIAELGYDDGGSYAYKDTKNNRKLNDTVVRDEEGNIVPPSKRFNYRSDNLFQSDISSDLQAQYDAVVARYKGTDQWLKAPNGKPTNLTERQWVLVRAPAFKEWFGDWEAAQNFKWLMDADPVSRLTGNEFQKENVSLSKRVSEYYAKEYGGVVSTATLGNIILAEDGIKASISHGLGRIKASAFMAVPDVLKNGRIFSEIEDYKGRGYTSLVVAAPLIIGNEEYIAEVVVNKSKGNKSEYYLHEVDIKRKLSDEPLQDTSLKGDSSTPASKLIVSLLRDRGKFNSSKVVDENGEPRVWYHFTDIEGIDVFKASHSRSSGIKGIFFTPQQYGAISSNLGKRRYDAFLNVRRFELAYGNKNKYAAELKELQRDSEDIDKTNLEFSLETGIDAFIDPLNSWPIILNPNLIKSATDNNGAFGTDNPSILYQEDFKPEFPEYSNHPEEAIEHLLKVKKGSVPAAITREEIGPIDFVYGRAGEKGYGLAHIQEMHPEILSHLSDLIRTGRVVRAYKDRYHIETRDAKAAIRLDWDGKKRTWLVTAYYYDENHLPSGTINDATSGLTSSYEPDLQVDRLPEMIDDGDSKVKLFQKAPPVGSREFQEEFGNSKVLGSDGRPLLVYHGSTSAFSSFDEKYLGLNTHADDAREGFFFTSSKYIAEGYAARAKSPESMDLSKEAMAIAAEFKKEGRSTTSQDVQEDPRAIRYWDILNEVEDSEDGDPTIIGAYLNIEHPLEIESSSFSGTEDLSRIIQQAKKDHDGVIVRGVEEDGEIHDIYIVFDDSQVGTVDNWESEDGIESSEPSRLFQLPDGVDDYNAELERVISGDFASEQERLAHASKIFRLADYQPWYWNLDVPNEFKIRSAGIQAMGSLRAHVMKNHNWCITDDHLRRVQEFINNPVAVVVADSPDNKGSLLFVTDMMVRFKGEMTPVVIALKNVETPNGETSTFVRSVFPWDKDAQGGRLSEIASTGRLLAVDKKRSESALFRIIYYTDSIRTASGKNVIQLEQEVKSTSPRLYQLSKEARESYLENRKEDVKNAVERMFWVSDSTLQEYAGEPWADNEIRFREHLRKYPWALEEARKFEDADDFLEYIQGQGANKEFNWTDEDEQWHRRIYAYSRIKSPEEMDRAFLRDYAKNDDSLIRLGNDLKAYQDIGQRKSSTVNRRDKDNRLTIWRWGAFKGVSTFVKNLSKNSSKAEIEKARKLVEQDPRSYRKALQTVQEAQDRVLEYKGILPRGDASRDAYYDALGEEMEEILAPLALNEMTDSEVAKYLRTSADKQQRFDARDRLATHRGVYAMELQADAELRAQGKAHLAEIEGLRKQLDTGRQELKATTEALGKYSLELRAVRTNLQDERNRSSSLANQLDAKSAKASKAAQLARDLADRRERVRTLRTQLTEQNQNVRSLEDTVRAWERRDRARKLRENIEDLQARVRKNLQFVDETMDASYEPVFHWVQEALHLARKEDDSVHSPWEQDRSVLEQYLDPSIMSMLIGGLKLEQWTVEDMEDLVLGVRMMGRDARIMHNGRMLDQSARRDAVEVAYYKQTIGVDPTISGSASVSYDLTDNLSTVGGKVKDDGLGKELRTANAWWTKMQRIARLLDGQKEGVLYDQLVRKAHYNQQHEFQNADTRIAEGKQKRTELGISDESLQKIIYTYSPVVKSKIGKGDGISLTRDQVIGLYIFSKEEEGCIKLYDQVVGNRLNPEQLSEAVGKLTDREKGYAEYLISALGGEGHWQRLAEVFYRVYNKRLGKRRNYFTFEAENKTTEGNTDLLVGPKGDPVRYTDKGFTKAINHWAKYALRLDATNIFEKNVRRQEHFIAWAQWVRDLNFMLSNKGALGRIISDRYGASYSKAVQNYVNDVGSPNLVLSDMDQMVNKIVSTASGATLAFSVSSLFRQVGSVSALFRGDISLYGYFKATAQLMNWESHAEAIATIESLAPELKHQAFDIDVARMRAAKRKTSAGRGLQKTLDIGMAHLGWMDMSIKHVLWLSAYQSYLKKNEKSSSDVDALSREAAFRASQFIAETQSVTNATDLNEIQRNKNPWLRLMFMFSNDTMQHINQVWHDIPYYWKQHDSRRIIGTTVSLALNIGLQMAISGAFLPDKDDDEEKERKKIQGALLEELVKDTMPMIGSVVSEGVSGWSGSGIVSPAPLGSLLQALTTGDDVKILDRIGDLMFEGAKVVGLPAGIGKKAIKSVQEMNPLYLVNSEWGKFGERVFGGDL